MVAVGEGEKGGVAFSFHVCPRRFIHFLARRMMTNEGGIVFVKNRTGLLMWSMGLGFFATLGVFMAVVWRPADRKRTSKREITDTEAMGNYKKI